MPGRTADLILDDQAQNGHVEVHGVHPHSEQGAIDALQSLLHNTPCHGTCNLSAPGCSTVVVPSAKVILAAETRHQVQCRQLCLMASTVAASSNEPAGGLSEGRPMQDTEALHHDDHREHILSKLPGYAGPAVQMREKPGTPSRRCTAGRRCAALERAAAAGGAPAPSRCCCGNGSPCSAGPLCRIPAGGGRSQT